MSRPRTNVRALTGPRLPLPTVPRRGPDAADHAEGGDLAVRVDAEHLQRVVPPRTARFAGPPWNSAVLPGCWLSASIRLLLLLPGKKC